MAPSSSVGRMSFARFFVLTCVVFALVGPLVPMTVAGISSAIATGEADKLLLPLALAPLSYMFGVPLALMYGGLSAVSLFAVAWLWPSLTRARAMQRIAVPLCTGFGVPLSLLAPYLASRYQSIVSNLLLHRHGWGENLAILWRLEASNLATYVLVPTLVCSCVVALVLLPKLAPDPSIER